MAGRADRVRIDGLKETQANLAFVPEATRQVFATRIGDMLTETEQGADERVPVDEGDLKASQGKNVRSDGLQGEVGYGDPKAPHVEFGTSRSRKKPFLYPAFRIAVRNGRRQWKADGEKIKSKVRRNYKGPKK